MSRYFFLVGHQFMCSNMSYDHGTYTEVQNNNPLEKKFLVENLSSDYKD